VVVVPLLVLPLVPEVPEVPVPLVPEEPRLPELPEVPLMPELPELPEVPLMPELSELPEVPLELPELPLVPELPPVPDAPELFMPPVPLEPRQVSVPLSPRLPLPLFPDVLLPLLVELSVELEPEVPLAPEEVRSAELLDFLCFFLEVDCFCGSVLLLVDCAATPALTSNAVRIKAILLFMDISFDEIPREPRLAKILPRRATRARRIKRHASVGTLASNGCAAAPLQAARECAGNWPRKRCASCSALSMLASFTWP
jgi:hypothetical protein